MSALTEFLAEQADLDLQLSRRALYVSQEAWDGPARSVASPSATVGWHGTDANKETGAVALVSMDGPLTDLVGDLVRVTRIHGGVTQPSVIVYVIDRVDADVEISLSRRAFQELGILANESIQALVEVLT